MRSLGVDARRPFLNQANCSAISLSVTTSSFVKIGIVINTHLSSDSSNK